MDFYKNSLRSDRLMNGIYKKNSLKNNVYRIENRVQDCITGIARIHRDFKLGGEKLNTIGTYQAAASKLESGFLECPQRKKGAAASGRQRFGISSRIRKKLRTRKPQGKEA